MKFLGQEVRFVQDNHSRSKKNVLRGLHYQISQPQGKLVRVLSGAIFDVAVDLRCSSPTFGRWTSFEMDADTHQMLWIPPGFAHGFLTLSDKADVLYKTTDYYNPSGERCLRFDDATVGIVWPLLTSPLLSDKDRLGKTLSEADLFI